MHNFDINFKFDETNMFFPEAKENVGLKTALFILV